MSIIVCDKNVYIGNLFSIIIKFTKVVSCNDFKIDLKSIKSQLRKLYTLKLLLKVQNNADYVNK